MDYQGRGKGTTPEAMTVIQVSNDGDLDPSVNGGWLRNGQILAIPHLIEFKMPVHEAHS